jgi:excisionase family DNA binding protein
MAPMKPPAPQRNDRISDVGYSLTHLASRWRVSRRDVLHLLQEGELPFVEVDGQLRVPRSAVRKLERQKPVK